MIRCSTSSSLHGHQCNSPLRSSRLFHGLLRNGTLLFAVCGLLGACDGETNAVADAASTPRTPPNAAYGEERIGYKSAVSAAESVASLPGDPSGMGANAAPPFYGSAGTGSVSGGYVPGAGGAAGYQPSAAGAFSAPEVPEVPEVPEPVPFDAEGLPFDGGAPLLKAAFLSQPPLPENPFRVAQEESASTFSIDVDTGSYTLARGSLSAGVLPARESVRVEEFINYFHLHYAQPTKGEPFSTYAELAACPWNPENQLLMLGIQGQEVPLKDQPPVNLVYLIDTSGSMLDAAKLPLLQRGFRMMTRQLRPVDRVSIVTYAGSAGVVLEAAAGNEQDKILAAINALQAGGSTAGGAGIQLAYQVAQQHFIPGGNNRILLATDGDFNVGISTTPELVSFIGEKRETGVYLSVYGFGAAWNGGNYNDEVGEQLADNGNGVYFYIDSAEEARRAFLHTITGSLLTVAKDVKLQVQFNPAQVAGHRLIGYENRVLANADFSNDTVDAGELGAGLSVTAFFEIIPAGPGATIPIPALGTDPLEDAVASGDAMASEELALLPVTGADLVDVRIRYKGADATTSTLLTNRYTPTQLRHATPSLKFQFASGVAELAMALRGSQYLPSVRFGEVVRRIESALPADENGAVAECQQVAQNALEAVTP